MKPKLTLFLLATVAVVAYWYNRPVPEKKRPNPPLKIEGQAFIVTNKGESLKLGDVRVSIVGKADFDKALNEATERHRGEIKDEDDMIARFSTEQKKVYDILVSATSDADRHAAAEVLELHNKSVGDAVERKRQTLDLVFDEVVLEIKNLNSARTDADGKFQLETNEARRDFYVFAYAKRKISGQDMSFIWVIDGVFADSPVLLSSDNLYLLGKSGPLALRPLGADPSSKQEKRFP